jgi:Flp pilus assembly pilin Flp
MRSLWRQFWYDERGSVGAEWAFVATILLLGAITGAIVARHTTLAEHEESPPALVR